VNLPRYRSWVRALTALCTLVIPCAPVAIAGAQERYATPDDFFARAVHLDAKGIASIARGEAVGKVLPTGDDRDVAVFGAVTIDVPRSFFVGRRIDYPRALTSATRAMAHLFSDPPSESDVQSIDVTDDDLKDLVACRPGACNFKLPATAMDRARQSIDASARDARARATAFVRQQMLAYVADYRARGNAAMLVYDDLGGVHGSDALTAMLRDSSLEFRVLPELGRFLTSYPHDTVRAAKQAMFWSVDRLPHARPVLRITHEVVFTPAEYPTMTVIADKQIYANHYFEAGLESLSAIDRPSAADASGSHAITLIAVRRYRFDHLPKGGLLNIRGRVVDGLRDNVVADLARMKREAEAAWHPGG
jgi:hypothetical protein